DDLRFSKSVEQGLSFLIRKEDERSGNLGGGRYAHGMATIALSEAYGVTQEANVRGPAQMAVNCIVTPQPSAAGWRYTPGQPGDQAGEDRPRNGETGSARRRSRLGRRPPDGHFAPPAHPRSLLSPPAALPPRIGPHGE